MSDTYMDLGERLEEAYADIENAIKSRLKKLMVLLKTPLKKFALSCMVEIMTRQGEKNHAEKEN